MPRGELTHDTRSSAGPLTASVIIWTAVVALLLHGGHLIPAQRVSLAPTLEVTNLGVTTVHFGMTDPRHERSFATHSVMMFVA